ncbi:hypothetical protein EKQ61_01460 [Staphylococcus gallinarum]|uniref:Phage protein n=1 Tax=Staphylococcus gallinarum TaxID=1293 RepID=A0A380FEV1_STAGA|nr:hypothetical protein [Staphylococcus gallinarum]RTX82861.1 hypothetical protein EKQ61_01460 [Staphylococcus gallinarum]GEQ04545.1 hypothetical protein SGA02_03730 [Staphylococcus gallinarum]SUM32099.1 Uncharacterised protein [Staphylococcus gallinarum]
MKIKTKKQLNLPQLIEWAMKNDMHERSFCGDRYGDAVHFDENEDMLCDHVSLTETFTVEVEEEIDEDTELNEILLIGNDGLFIESYNNHSINGVLSNNGGYYDETLMLILQPEPQVIWTKDKGLME